jgi:hypothetical protein
MDGSSPDRGTNVEADHRETEYGDGNNWTASPSRTHWNAPEFALFPFRTRCRWAKPLWTSSDVASILSPCCWPCRWPAGGLWEPEIFPQGHAVSINKMNGHLIFVPFPQGATRHEGGQPVPGLDSGRLLANPLAF